MTPPDYPLNRTYRRPPHRGDPLKSILLITAGILLVVTAALGGYRLLAKHSQTQPTRPDNPTSLVGDPSAQSTTTEGKSGTPTMPGSSSGLSSSGGTTKDSATATPTVSTTTSHSTTTATSPVSTTTTPASTAPTPAAVVGQNPLLLPRRNFPALPAAAAAAGQSPAEMKLTGAIIGDNSKVLNASDRGTTVTLTDPLDYQAIDGVLTFRGNNLRSAAAYGTTPLSHQTMTQIWRKGIGSVPANAFDGNWTGTGWTGQPLLVRWSPEVRRIMNLVPEKKAKENLVEVIYATMDGNIYFLDLDDGAPTRSPINIGKMPIKGTPAVDPRGWPILYVGQGDYEKGGQRVGGFRIFSLIDQKMLFFKNGTDPAALRKDWGNCDSSPIIDGASDTLIYPNENGMIYTVRLNTRFDPTAGTLSIDPRLTSFQYSVPQMPQQGIESSIAVYGKYGWYTDNSGQLICLDLNTLQPVWVQKLPDDSDVTPVLERQADGQLALYTATEVDWQQDVIGIYKGKAYTSRFDALTGKLIWQVSFDCYTKNAKNVGDDINGGALGTPVVGKKDLADLVVFSYCMTNGVYSGNSVVAYNKADGRLVWEYKMRNYTWSSPVDIYDENGKGYIVIPEGNHLASNLHLIDGRTGKEVKIIPLTAANGNTIGNIESSAAIFGDKLVVGSRGNWIVAVQFR